MEVKVSCEALLREVNLLVGVVEKKTTLPATACFRLEAVSDGRLQLTATDCDVTVRTDCAAEVTRPGVGLLPARRLTELTRRLSGGEVTLKFTEASAGRIVCNGSQFRLLSPSPEDYPSLPSPPAASFGLSGEALRTLLSRVLFAVSREELRHQLRAVQFSVLGGDDGPARLRLVATDSHRLALAETPLAEAELPAAGSGLTCLIDAKALQEAQRLAAAEGSGLVHIGWDEDFAALIFGRRRLTARLSAGLFPNYASVLPGEQENTKLVVLERAAFSAALRRVGVVADTTVPGVKIALKAGEVELSARSPELGEAVETLPADYVGPKMELGFNWHYLVDMLEAVSVSRVRLGIKDEISAVEVRPLDDGPFHYRYVVMPMRL